MQNPTKEAGKIGFFQASIVCISNVSQCIILINMNASMYHCIKSSNVHNGGVRQSELRLIMCYPREVCPVEISFFASKKVFKCICRFKDAMRMGIYLDLGWWITNIRTIGNFNLGTLRASVTSQIFDWDQKGPSYSKYLRCTCIRPTNTST